IQEKPPFDKKREGSIGVPFPNTLARIVDPETGKDVPIGQMGELIIKGPQVMKGYWNNPAETAHQLRNGWLHTGDIARMDDDGYFYILDRLKQMIDRSGFKIYPRQVEEVLFEHPAVADAAVVGIPSEKRGEAVMAFVVLKEGATATVEEIRAFCKERLTYYKVPEFIEFRSELPKSMVGKTLRRVLREEYLEKQGSS
ncbi:MAG: AMP-binding protein, partial [Promethearchaeota archaeon]